MSFDSTKKTLEKLLEQVKTGALQLPEFQRDYVWTDEAVISLLCSIARGYPVGAILLLERGGEVDFKPRMIEGVKLPAPVQPEELLLDGQQRMTSLFQTLYSTEPAKLKNIKNQRIDRHVFLNIPKAVAEGVPLDEAFELLPGDKRRMTNFGRDVDLDLSTAEGQYAAHMFPLDQVFDEDDWIYGWRDFWRDRGVDVNDTERALKKLIKIIQKYEMPVIRLTKDNGREAVCTIFEKVNVGGVKLDAFELVTAIYAGADFDLREDWSGNASVHGRLGRIRKSTHEHGVHADLKPSDFLQACTVLHTMDLRDTAITAGKQGLDLPQVTCRRDALLKLPLEAYKAYAPGIEKGYIEAGSFLNDQKIFWGRDLPYPAQVAVIAAVFARLGKRAKHVGDYEKLAQWFWSVVLGEYYGSTTETKIARDVAELTAWMDGGPPPRTLDETLFQQSRLKSLRSRGSAAYKGFHALLMRQGCKDFLSGRSVELMTVFSNPLDIHHIFPRVWCEARGIPASRYNSIINKTALDARTNRIIGGNAPSAYLARLQQQSQLSVAAMDGILETHLIDPNLLRADDFDAFFDDRARRLGALASHAMGRDIVMDWLLQETNTSTDDDLSMDDEDSIEEAL
jgi:hypothetical protein